MDSQINQRPNKWIAQSLVTLAFIALLCLGAAAELAAQDKKDDYRFAMPIEYRSLGVGPQPALGHIPLEPGLEASKITRAILNSLQKMDMNIIKPKLDLDDPLPQRKEWTTDVVQISALQIQAHNQAAPGMKLPENHLYGLQYKGKYQIVNRELVFTLTPILMHRGAGGKFRSFNRPYSGMYFHNVLKTAMVIELAKPDGT